MRENLTSVPDGQYSHTLSPRSSMLPRSAPRRIDPAGQLTHSLCGSPTDVLASGCWPAGQMWHMMS